MALNSTPESPQQLGVIVEAMRDWVGRLGEVWIQAQVTQINRRNQPTQFLTFRDTTANVNANVTVSRRVLDAAGPLPEGATVVARVKPRVWVPSTSLSLECLELRVAGEGRLLADIERLKRVLQAEGLFDASRKKPLPVIPHCIGLVTGAGSDAERDVLTNTSRRWPARFKTKHVLVQGSKSAESIILALRELDADPEVDVVIVARGGGSLQDLLAFYDEGMVRTIAQMHTPVITAIGHEMNEPLVDYVADARASTPTHAASLVVPDFAEEQKLVQLHRDRLQAAITRHLTQLSSSLEELRSRPVLRDPLGAFTSHEQWLLLSRHQLRHRVEQLLTHEQALVDRAVATIRALSPKATLERGYAVLVGPDQSPVASVRDVHATDRIQAWLHDGQLDVEVLEVKEQA